MTDFCGERRLYVGNTYFKHQSFPKYTRVARGQHGAEVMSMIGLVLVKKDMLCYVHNVRDSERNRTRPLRSLCCSLES